MSRKTHLVGAWPGMSAPHAMETAFQRVGDHLLRMSDGETGERCLWVTPTIEWMRANPDVELEIDSPYESYAISPQWKVKEDRTFDPDNIHLGYLRAFQESYPAFCFLREKHGQPDVSFQVGIPMPIDLAVDVFGMERAMSDPDLSEAFRVATVRQIEAIHEVAGDDVIFQIETVVGLVAITMTPEAGQAETAAKMATEFNEVVAASPKGTRFGAHLCLGDFHHKSLGRMSDATPVVLMANALAKSFPKTQALEYIHVPFAAAEEPGSLDESWYMPLTDLDVPANVRFVAGFIHESLDREDHGVLLTMIERLARREVDVAAACGLARRPDAEQAWDAMDKAIALIES